MAAASISNLIDERSSTTSFDASPLAAKPISADEAGVTFKCKDYHIKGRDRLKA